MKLLNAAKLSIAAIAAACLTLGAGNAASALTLYTEIEPNDDIEAAQLLEGNDGNFRVDGILSSADIDFFEFFVEGGNFLTLTANVTGDVSGFILLGLFDSSNTPLALGELVLGDDPISVNSLIRDFTINTSDFYKVGVAGFADDDLTSDFTYELVASTRPVPTPALVPGAIALTASLLRKRKAEAAAQKAEA